MSKVKYYYDPDTLSYKKIQTEKRNTLRLITGFITTFSIGIVISFIFPGNFDKNIESSTDNGIKDRIENLEKISSDLKGLSEFIESQKSSLKEQNRTLAELKSENQKLEKVVGINKENVEALFQIQEENAKKRIWTDRIIGFLFGLAGSFLIALLFRFLDKRKVNNIPSLDDEVYVKKTMDKN